VKAFKFMIKPGDPRVVARVTMPGGGERVTEAENRLAIAIAETQEEALALLTRLAEEEGDDARWLVVADVIPMNLDMPKRLCWVEH
jgi:hypothetical protein